MVRTKNNNPDAQHSNRSGKERYYISSLPLGIEEVARTVRGHWMVESYRWHLDVTFREDGNHTLEKQASYNLNIMRKVLYLYCVINCSVAKCKYCGAESQSIHSWYVRTISDLPIQDYQVKLVITVSKFFVQITYFAIKPLPIQSRLR